MRTVDTMRYGFPSQINLFIQFAQGKALQAAELAESRGYAKLLYLYNFSDQPVRSIREKLKSFTTINHIIEASKPGTISPPEKNLMNVDAMVLLYHPENPELVEAKAKQIEQMEATNTLF